MPISRRGVVSGLLAAPIASALASRAAVAQDGAPALPATPACDDAHPTPRSSEGPFYTPDSPRRHDIAADVSDGRPLHIGGFVLAPDCRPLADAVVDIWQCDDAGRYDNDGYRLRGHQMADAAGRWWFATIVPAAYPGRTRHIHVKVAPTGGRVLTTQLFFPGEPGNARDRLYDDRLLLGLSEAEQHPFGRFDFILG